MDTLSTSVSTLNLPSLPPPLPRELRCLKSNSHRLPSPPKSTSIISSNQKQTSSFSLSFNHKKPPQSAFSQSLKPLKSQPYKNPATGYAAALVLIAQRKNRVEKTQEEVQRLSRILDGVLEEQERGKFVKEVTERGKFGKHLVGLVRMLVERGKVGILGEVLEEFERIYDEMVGTKVVYVSSKKKKMEEEELFGIAARVQKVVGGDVKVKVKVKVRNFVDESLPAIFAM